MKWLVGLGALLWSLQAQAQPAALSPQTVALITDKACADLDTESAFAKELRLRLPEMALKVGATDASDSWFLNWVPRDDSCWLEVRGLEVAELEIPNPAKQGDLELAASQVAWIVTMSVQDVEPEPEPPVLTEKPEDPPLPPPLAPIEASKEVAGPSPTETVVEPVIEPDPETSIIEGGVVLGLFPGVSIPQESQNQVPALALELISPGYLGIRGLELALFWAAAGFVDGLQMAVGASLTGDLTGYQFSMGYNGANRVEGGQIGMGVNHADQVDGLQLALGVNIADDVDGLQAALFGNIADDIGLQVSLGANIADAVTLQVGAVNVADRAALQIGLVNISETSEVPIGLVNIMTEEPFYLTAWAGTSGFMAAGVLHGGKRFRYGYVVAGMPWTDTETQVIGFGLGASLHFDFDGWFFDTELYGFQVAEDPAKQNFLANLRAVFGWQLQERFAIFAGPALVSYWSGAPDGLGVQPDYSAQTLGGVGAANRWDWIEVQAGVRF